VVVGTVLSFSKLPNAYALAVFYGLMGLVVMISGGWVLFCYLRENPLPTEEQ
jgi:hypothetical protein